MAGPVSIAANQRKGFFLTLLMNLTVLPLSLSWTALGILLFPAPFVILKTLTRWKTDRITRELIRVYARGCVLILAPFVRIKWVGSGADKIKPPCILVVNHLSFLDLYSLAMMPTGDVSLAIRNWPFKMFWYAPFMHLSRYLNVEAAEWQQVSEKAARLLSNGAALLFFPEGHRSRNGRLQRFHSGAFRLAAETGIKIIPLCIKGTSEILPPGRWWFKPGRVTIKALEPVDPGHFTEPAAHRTIRKIVKTRMAQALMEKSVVSKKTQQTLPLPAEALIPHRQQMCMVDQLIAVHDRGGTVEAIIASDNVLLDDDAQLDPLGAAEMMAQAFAAVKGYADRLSDEPVKQGYLVGIRKIQFLGNVYAGDRLRISVETVGAISGFAVVAGQVTRDQDVIARGELKLWTPEDSSLEAQIK